MILIFVILYYNVVDGAFWYNSLFKLLTFCH